MKFRNNTLKHEQFVYAVYDKVSNNTLTVFNCDSDTLAIRQSVPIFLPQYPLKDLEVRKIAIIDSSSSQLHVIKPIVIDWKLYEFPETRAESLAPLGLNKDDYDKMTALDLYHKLAKSETRFDVENALEAIKLNEKKLESEVKHE